MTSVFARLKHWLFNPERLASRPRLHFHEMPAAIYAIGDVHGCLNELKLLENRIIADADTISGEKWIIFLGDLIDRGPSSAQTLDHILSRSTPGIKTFCLAGNHEAAFLQFLENGGSNKEWLTFGGYETLASYGLHALPDNGKLLLQKVNSHIPDEHITFLRALPIMITVENYCFVHAGIDPKKALDAQNDDVLLWSRPNEFDWTSGFSSIIVIHGHTPVDTVQVTVNRINVDIGAYARGTLAAIRIKNNEISIMTSR